jgi:hypothetical protein
MGEATSSMFHATWCFVAAQEEGQRNWGFGGLLSLDEDGAFLLLYFLSQIERGRSLKWKGDNDVEAKWKIEIEIYCDVLSIEDRTAMGLTADKIRSSSAGNGSRAPLKS